MDALIERCAGLDVHKKTVAVCVRVPGPDGARQQHIRTVATMTADLLALRAWLTAHRVTHVAMENTGVYWKPVYYVLEDAFRCLLVNAAHMHNVPGRKTDVQDCVWIAQWLECGLLRGSFVPPAPIRELRDLVRSRKVLTQERAREAQRLHKVLEDTGVKLASVARDILGVSGRAMLDALAAGTTDPDVLDELARGRLRAKLPALRQALVGRFRRHHALLVSELLAHLDYLEGAIVRLSEPIAEQLRPFGARLTPLDAIPGVNQRTIEGVVAEIGLDLRLFPSDRHLVSWAGLCPGHHESAGKHTSGTPRKGNRWLRATLVEAALAAVRVKESRLAARYRRIMRHRGHKKAVVAVAHTILVMVYHMLKHGVPYHELGANYLDQREREQATRRHVKQLERLGHHVILEPVA
ncbi:MAG: IS110 family transposase [Nitrospira sp.]|nr:IS110 family transposase [Nitrospira sp.]